MSQSSSSSGRSSPSVEDDYPQRVNLMTFDNSDVNMFDVELVVEEQSFYVMKGFLARHSTSFRSLFFDDYKEKGKKRIELQDIGAYEFQLFLECINGCPCIDENTVESIAKMADRWNAPMALVQCEKFLMKEPKEKMKKSFEIAMQYKMDKLKAKLITDIQTTDELLLIAPTEYNTTLDAKTLFEFLQKAMFLLTREIANPTRPTTQGWTELQLQQFREEENRHTNFMRRFQAAYQVLSTMINEASDHWNLNFQAVLNRNTGGHQNQNGGRNNQNLNAAAAPPGPAADVPIAPQAIPLNQAIEVLRALQNYLQQQQR